MKEPGEPQNSPMDNSDLAAEQTVQTRVYHLAKQFGILSRDVIARCEAEGIQGITNHMSVVPLGLAATIRQWFSESPCARLDRLCTAFDKSLRLRQPEQIEGILVQVPEAERSKLLEELVGIEHEFRWKCGDMSPLPTLAEYKRRFPTYSDTIERAFSTSDKGGVRYALLEEIGTGRFGTVFKARDTTLGRDVAVKVLRREFLTDKGLQLFKQEAETLAQIRDTGIVTVHDTGHSANGLPYIVMDYFPGRSLCAVINDAPDGIDPQRAVALMIDIATTVHAVHELGSPPSALVHQDLKPENILLDKSGKPVVADFGLAASVAAMHAGSADIGATVAYASPEQIARFRNKPSSIDRRSDIWSLGVILCELLTGKRPFSGGSSDYVMHLITECDPVPPRDFKTDLPEGLQSIVLKCLKKSPRDRYQTADSLKSALRAWLQGSNKPHADLRAKLSRAMELHARDEGPQAIALLEEVYHTAKSLDAKREWLAATLNLGFARFNRTGLREIKRRLSEADTLLREVDDKWYHIRYFCLKAKLLQHQKNHTEAERKLTKAIALVNPCDDTSIAEAGLLARAHYVHLLCEMNQSEEAQEHVACLHDAIGQVDTEQPSALIAELLNACIHWSAVRHDSDLARSLIALAYQHAEGEDNAVCIGHTLHDCANGARSIKATEIAVLCADAAEQLGRAARRPDMSLAAGFTAAGALAEARDDVAALERCMRLVDAAETMKQPKLCYAVFHLLSQLCRERGDRPTAVKAAERALRSSEGDTEGLCMGHLVLAQALSHSGRTTEAIEHAQSARQLAERCQLPPECQVAILELLAGCAAAVGDWALAEESAGQVAQYASESQVVAGHAEQVIKNRIKIFRAVREALEAVGQSSDPLAEAGTSGATSIHEANASLMQGVLEAWRVYPSAATAVYDYWGRGNLLRAMLNMKAFTGVLNLTLEVHTVDEARRAIRFWALIADVLVLIWKGPTISSNVMCPVPLTFRKAGGGGYVIALTKGTPIDCETIDGRSTWRSRTEGSSVTGVIATPHASLLPDDVGHFLVNEAYPFIAQGRLIIVPSTGIGAVGSGHGPIERLFAEACNACPAIKGDAVGHSSICIPYFADAPLCALAEVVQSHAIPLRRLRNVLLKQTRALGPYDELVAKSLELELHETLAGITELQADLRQRHGWTGAGEVIASSYECSGQGYLAPLLMLQNMGYGWRMERAFSSMNPSAEELPRDDEPIATWLHPPDTSPTILESDAIREMMRRKKRRRST